MGGCLDSSREVAQACSRAHTWRCYACRRAQHIPWPGTHRTPHGGMALISRLCRVLVVTPRMPPSPPSNPKTLAELLAALRAKGVTPAHKVDRGKGGGGGGGGGAKGSGQWSEGKGSEVKHATRTTRTTSCARAFPAAAPTCTPHPPPPFHCSLFCPPFQPLPPSALSPPDAWRAGSSAEGKGGGPSVSQGGGGGGPAGGPGDPRVGDLFRQEPNVEVGGVERGMGASSCFSMLDYGRLTHR